MPQRNDRRALLIVLDSVGIGHAPDADDFGDLGADTLGHIRETVSSITLPNLESLGLAASEAGASGKDPGDHTLESALRPGAAFGWMREKSVGKDTTTGHWEIAGAPISTPFQVFDKFPGDLVSAIESSAHCQFIGNYPQSGTVILDELGAAHLSTGKLILYTSADSVIQIAAHEDVVPVDRLYSICKMARKLADEYRIGRVIARPFVGSVKSGFQRTTRRKDFSIQPPPTVLNALTDAGVATIGIGKIGDIFAGSGIQESFPTKSNKDGMDTIDRLWEGQPSGLIFANLVDFDMHFGHRRDPVGYGRALEEFDVWLGKFLPKVTSSNDLVLITADHGNDPTWPGSDHTREMVPLLAFAPSMSFNTPCLGLRSSFSDVAASLVEWFGTSPWPTGVSIF